MDDVDINKEDLNYLFLDDEKIKNYALKVLSIIKQDSPFITNSSVANSNTKNPTPDFTFSVSFVGVEKMRELNQKFRQKNEPTDVLSFSQGFSKEQEFILPINLLGDIIICPDYCKESAKSLGISFEEEISRLVIHGLLHLFDFDHESNDFQKEDMLQYQEKILGKLGNAI